ncbi:acetate non-utilizing protein 9 [Blyttiomyces sp. JEL0837]|nr:acetate non-utilizing protein 9 [Blyttiomyces sp. JEL0837]
MEGAVKLYSQIWRLHRLLPPDLRFMGNKYIQDEFARHRTADQAQLQTFVKEWTNYKDSLAKQLQMAAAHDAQVKFGQNLSPQALESMTDDQIGTLTMSKKSKTN